ncbi:MAG: PAS domain S-box protein [Verrucomicrobia bacterium]|nr:PAS domain S-box protein [Verrucomicrobiota bacterium]
MPRNRRTSWWPEHLRRMGAAYLVLIISLVPTLLAYQAVKRNARERDNERFDQIIRAKHDAVERRAVRYLDKIVSLGGFFTANETLDAAEWNRLTRSATVAEQFPGFQLLGFAEVVPSAARAEHEVKWRPLAGADYAIRPLGQRDSYCPVVLLNKLDATNRLALGADAFADPNLQPVLEQALEAGAGGLSGRVLFPWFAGRSAERVVAVQPVFLAGRPVATPAERKAALRGYVFGVLDMARLLEGIFGSPADQGLRAEVFIGNEPLPIHSVFASSSAGSTGPAQFLREVPVRVADRQWLLVIESSPAFEASLHKALPPIVLGLGISLNLLLFGIAWAQARARMEAERLAEDLRQVQERDRLLERATNDAIWDWDIAAGRVAWNEAVQAMFRYSAEAVSPQLDWWMERLHSEDRRRVWNGREAAVQTGGEFWADEYRFRRGDGTFAYVIDRGFIIHDRQGVAVRMIGSMVDISAQREAEEARQQSERKLALHIQQTPLAVIEWNLSFQVTSWNPAAERIFGYPAREAIGRHAAELILVPSDKKEPGTNLFTNLLAGVQLSEEAREHVQRTWRSVLKDTPPEPGKADSTKRQSINAFAVTNRTKSQRPILCDWYNTPLVDATGQIVGVASLVLDVTGRKHAEDALAAEKERLTVTLRSIGDGVIATDIEGRVSIINKHAEDLTGWRQGDALGQPLPTVFSVVHQRTRQTYRNPVSQVLAAGEVVDLPDQSMLVSRTGTERLIAASAAPIRDLESKIIGSVLVFRDISDQQAIMEERVRASKLDSLGILAGGIAHDFNNILTAVIGNVSFARLFCQPGEKQFERLEEAEKAALRAKDLATQLLTFAKGGAPVRQTASLTESIRDSTSFALRGSNVRCEFQAAPGLWPVEVDQGQFSQVIQNLVINSVQAMPAGGVVRVFADNVTLAADSPIALPPGRYCRITVKDHGLGIKPEHLGKVFDPYFTTKEKGTGLGLATSYSIVKKHDGIMTVDSTLGVGSEFHVYLPASEKQVAPVAPEPVAPVQGQGRILVMDDEELIRELAQTALEFLGYQVDEVSDGEACIQAYIAARADGKPYAAIIMDLTIPGGMGGKEAIQRLLEIDPDVCAIVSSGYSHGPEMANHKQHGFRGMVGKPYKIEELAREITAVIGGK